MLSPVHQSPRTKSDGPFTVPESAYFKVPETLKTFRMYPISRFVYVLHCIAFATRLIVMYVIKIKQLPSFKVTDPRWPIKRNL